MAVFSLTPADKALARLHDHTPPPEPEDFPPNPEGPRPTKENFITIFPGTRSALYRGWRTNALTTRTEEAAVHLT